jgi:hypothetical protein
MNEQPHEQRRGWLKHNNPPGNFLKAKRCGARNRRGSPCCCPAMPNGRCRLHGGLSTGPKTPEGKERARRANLKHGRFTAEAIRERREVRAVLRQAKKFFASLT